LAMLGPPYQAGRRAGVNCRGEREGLAEK
jgi:hypothetical protein